MITFPLTWKQLCRCCWFQLASEFSSGSCNNKGIESCSVRFISREVLDAKGKVGRERDSRCSVLDVENEVSIHEAALIRTTVLGVADD